MIDRVGRPLAAHAHALAKEALRLRIERGLSFDKIADQLGYGTPAAAWNAYKSALDWSNVERDIDSIIDAEAQRLDHLTEKLTSQPFISARDAEVLVKIAERKARLLGLDAPEKKIIAGKFDIDTRITEVEPDFVAGVIQELNRTNRPALAANHEKSVDSAQADDQTGGVSTRATA